GRRRGDTGATRAGAGRRMRRSSGQPVQWAEVREGNRAAAGGSRSRRRDRGLIPAGAGAARFQWSPRVFPRPRHLPQCDPGHKGRRPNGLSRTSRSPGATIAPWRTVMSNNLSGNFGEDARCARHDGSGALTDEALATVSGGGKAASSKNGTYLTFTFKQVFVNDVPWSSST